MSLRANVDIQLHSLAGSLGLRTPLFHVVQTIPGGFGVCAKIIHEESGEAFALKGLRPDRLHDVSMRTRFVDEAKLWLSLSVHNGVVEAIAVDRVDESPVVAARWMSGGDLRMLLQLKDPRPFFQTTWRVIKTLKWVWDEYGVVHRDLKPENILLDLERRAFVSDWGIARVAVAVAHEVFSSGGWDPDRPSLTKGGMGTLLYAAPEQLADARTVDHRADMYALGCVLYEWEAGRPPFGRGRPREIVHQHMYEPPAPLDAAAIDSGAQDLIMRCLAKRPEDRFSSYDELLASVETVASERGVEIDLLDVGLRRDPLPVGRHDYDRFLKDEGSVVSRSGSHVLAEREAVDRYLEEGTNLMALGEYKKALPIFQSVFVPELVREFPELPQHLTASINYAVCLVNLERPGDAIAVLQHLDGLEAPPVEYFINLSNAHLHAKQFEEAEEVAVEGLDVFDTDSDLVGNLILAKANQGKTRDLMALIERRLGSDRGFNASCDAAVALVAVADGLREMDYREAARMYHGAVALLERAGRLNPSHRKPGLLLVQAWFKVGNYVEASTVVGRVQKMNIHPQEAEYLAGLQARCLVQVAAFSEAIGFCDRWLEHFPDSLELQRAKARAVIDGFCIGKTKGGAKVVAPWPLEFLGWLVDQPDLCKADDFCDLASLCSWTGDHERALELLEEALQRWPEYHETPAITGELFLARDIATAARYAEMARETAPWRYRTWRLSFQVAEAQGDVKSAESFRARHDEVVALGQEWAETPPTD